MAQPKQLDGTFYEVNTFSLIITWTLADGSPRDLTNAAVVSCARNVQTGATVDLTATVTDGPAGQVRVSAPSRAFDCGVYEIQTDVTKDSVIRTHAVILPVSKSIKEAA